ncbi:solute carrier organic anion transporter family member 4A1-like isoform X2 [Convolutriloba macropyga]
MVLYGLAQTTLSTLEKRYSFKSSSAGFLLSMADVGIAVTLIPISYFGSNVNKCQWVAYGALSFSAGCFIYACPHFLSPDYHLSSNLTSSQEGQLCTKGNLSTQLTVERKALDCDPHVHESSADDMPTGFFYFLFCAGRFLQGAGLVPLQVLAVVYIFDNTPPSRGAIYIGIIYCLTLLGPILGYLLGAGVLRIYVDVDKVIRDDISIDTENPLWIGAWWVGFISCAGLALLAAIPIAMYPKYLPSYKEAQTLRKSEVHGEDNSGKSSPGTGSPLERSLFSADESESHMAKLKQVCGATVDLMKNTPFVYICVSNACDAFMIFGMAAFFPKFLEAQFNFTAGEAAFMAAAVAVPSAVLGTLFGSWAMKRFDMSATETLSFCKWVTFISIPMLLVFLVPCGSQEFAGVNIEYSPDPKGFFTSYNESLDFVSSLDAYCNLDCNCINEDYFPVCGADNIQYYSPCHAGCTARSSTNNKDEEKFSNCSCVGNPNSGKAKQSAQPGLCGFECTYGFAIYLGLFSIILSTAVPFVPTKAAILRIVPEYYRSLSLGIRWVISCVFGSIPGPVLIGFMFDRGCDHWLTECDEKLDQCVAYDAKMLRLMSMLVAAIMKVLSTTALLAAEKSYRPPVEDITDEKKNEDNNSSESF